MSQLVLDDQLDVQIIVPALEAWISAVRLQELRPTEHILDDRVPEILRTLKTPTFLTIDHGFWKRRLCHPAYCILYLTWRKMSNINFRPCCGVCFACQSSGREQSAWARLLGLDRWKSRFGRVARKKR